MNHGLFKSRFLTRGAIDILGGSFFAAGVCAL